MKTSYKHFTWTDTRNWIRVDGVNTLGKPGRELIAIFTLSFVVAAGIVTLAVILVDLILRAI